MDRFKENLRTRQVLNAVGLLGVVGAVSLSRLYEKAKPASDHIEIFILGFQTGVIIAMVAFLVSFFVKSSMAMRDPERLKKLYVSETDERNLFIQQKTGSVGMNIVMYGVAAAAVVAGNINETVFFTLLCACIFITLVRGVLKLYYRNKY